MGLGFHWDFGIEIGDGIGTESGIQGSGCKSGQSRDRRLTLLITYRWNSRLVNWILLLIGIGNRIGTESGIQDQGANQDNPEEEDSHYEQLADEILG